MSEEKREVTIPFYAVESMLDRQGLTIKRLWIICILLIVLLVGTNALWLWYESQWEYYEEVEQDIESEMEDGDFTVIGIGNNYGNGQS